jgi:hypothetical protein
MSAAGDRGGSKTSEADSIVAVLNVVPPDSVDTLPAPLKAVTGTEMKSSFAAANGLLTDPHPTIVATPTARAAAIGA